MNQFEQISSHGNQMPPAEVWGQGVTMSHARRRAEGGVALYSKVQCIVGHGHMGIPLIHNPLCVLENGIVSECHTFGF